MLNYRRIEAADDKRIAEIIRMNLKKLHLDVPGTAYFDPELEHLSAYYNINPSKRVYFVALDPEGQVVGGVGIAEFDGIKNCAELQKLYLDDSAKGKGWGKELMRIAENWARSAGYENLYLETHTNLTAALQLYEKTGFRQIEKPCRTPHGTSEEYLGRAIKNNASRDKVVLASKVYFNDGHLSKEAINREIDGTLKRLGTDYLDLYIIHRFDYGTPIEETMEALHNLVKAGKVRALGASAMYGYQFYNMQLAARDNGWSPFVSIQNHYNLIYREDERELIPLCKQMNVALTPYSPLAAGRLCRADWHADTKRSKTDYGAAGKYDKNESEDHKIVMRVKELADKYGKTMTQIALAWQFKKGIASPIIGATKPKYFDDAAGALEFELTDEDAAYLEELYTPHNIVGALPNEK